MFPHTGTEKNLNTWCLSRSWRLCWPIWNLQMSADNWKCQLPSHASRPLEVSSDPVMNPSNQYVNKQGIERDDHVRVSALLHAGPAVIACRVGISRTTVYKVQQGVVAAEAAGKGGTVLAGATNKRLTPRTTGLRSKLGRGRVHEEAIWTAWDFAQDRL